MTTPDQPSGDPTDTAAGATYSYKPSLMGAAFEARLEPDALAWQAGGRTGRIPYGDIRRLRLSFRPVTMQSQRFLTEIWPTQGPKIVLASCSGRSMFEQERRDAPYAAFVTELHRRLAAAQSSARFDAGSPPLLYWPAVTLFAGVSLSIAALLVRALQLGALGGAAFIAAFLALFLWQAGTFFRRNKPRAYTPDNPPRDLVPTGK